MLSRETQQRLHVLVVWEPILATDWKSPSSTNLGRIGDQRARQFWDPHHLVATALNDAVKHNSTEARPPCCFDKGFYWDNALVYPSGAHWETAPAPVFWNGPVYRIIAPLESTLTQSR